MSATCCTPEARARLTPATKPRPSFWQAVMRFPGLAKQRRDLAALAPHLLADIGLSPEQARREAARPLWDAPEHWRRHS